MFITTKDGTAKASGIGSAAAAARRVPPPTSAMVFLSERGIEEDCAQDLTAEEQRLLTALQPQTAGAIFGAKPWRSRPVWYVVSDRDRMIAPEQEKSMARQLKARTTVLPASHVVMLSRPKEVAEVIIAASADTRR